eukprot:8581559-Prorocentrum_lima.AAC.1
MEKLLSCHAAATSIIVGIADSRWPTTNSTIPGRLLHIGWISCRSKGRSQTVGVRGRFTCSSTSPNS